MRSHRRLLVEGTAAEAAYVPLPTGEKGKKATAKGMPHLMRFVTAQALAPTATMKRSDSNSHQMNERPRSHSSKVVMSIMPSATLSKMMPISRPIASAGAGEEFIAPVSHGWKRAEGRDGRRDAPRRTRGGFHLSLRRIKLKARRHQCVGDG